MKRKAVDAREIVNLRGMPAAADIERLILGSVLVDGTQRMDLLAGALTEASFHLPAHRWVWEALVQMRAEGDSLDRVSLARRLTANGKLEAVGGLAAIVSLDEGLPSLVAVDGWVRTLQDLALRRAAIVSLNDAMTKCLTGDSDALSAAVSVAEAISQATTDRAGLNSSGEVIESIGIQEFCSPSNTFTGGVEPPQSWPNFRDLIPRFRAGQLILVAALTSAGKSTFVAEIALEAALRGETTAIFSLEMRADEILPRMASAISHIDSYAHANGRMRPEERIRFQAAAAQLAEIPLYIDDRSTQTVATITAAVRRMRTRPRLIVVDYLQLAESSGRYENRVQAIAEISRGLKRLAGDMDAPVIALSQLSRRPAQDDRRPELHDLRDSGSLEQDANVVVMLHPDKATAMLPETGCDVIVAKNRGGRKGVVKMLFRKPIARFVEG